MPSAFGGYAHQPLRDRRRLHPVCPRRLGGMHTCTLPWLLLLILYALGVWGVCTPRRLRGVELRRLYALGVWGVCTPEQWDEWMVDNLYALGVWGVCTPLPRHPRDGLRLYALGVARASYFIEPYSERVGPEIYDALRRRNFPRTSR